MTHAATLDLGRNAQTRQSGSRLPVAMLTLALIVATIAAVWFASRAGVFGGTAATPAVVDRSFDQIEAQRGVVGLSGDRGAYLNGILDGAHATPFAATLPSDVSSVRRGYAVEVQPARVVALPGVLLPDNVSSARRGYPVAAAAKALPHKSPAASRSAARARAAALRAQPDNVSSARRGYAAAALAVTLPDNVSSSRRGYAATAAVTTNLWSWRGQAAGAAKLPDDLSVRRGYPVEGPPSTTSRTFHLGR